MFLWVEYFLKMHIVVSFMLLHPSSHSLSRKSTLFKPDFNENIVCYFAFILNCAFSFVSGRAINMIYEHKILHTR